MPVQKKRLPPVWFSRQMERSLFLLKVRIENFENRGRSLTGEVCPFASLRRAVYFCEYHMQR